jgi:hypothetical protein
MSKMFDTVSIIIYSLRMNTGQAGETPQMSFREKSAWISLLSYVGVYGYYFWTVYTAAVAGAPDSFRFDRLVRPMFLLAVIDISLQMVVALSQPGDARAAQDERERLITLKATHPAFHVVMFGAAIMTAAMALGLPTFFAVNGLFLAMVLGEVVKYAGQIAHVRMGA